MAPERSVNSKRSSPIVELPCPPNEIDEFLCRPAERTIETLRGRAGPYLVLGAGGKMGLHLSVILRRALDRLGRSDRVIAVSRFGTVRDRSDFARFGVETLACDLENPEELKRLPDAPALFFLAGVKFGTAGAADLLHRINAEMPRRVAARFRTSTIAAFSTGCVYPFVTPGSGGATEETAPLPNGEYAASCLEREHAFQAASDAFGTKAALIRLNYSVEFRYGILVDIALKVLRGESIDVTMGYANAIWQTDALNYAIESLELAAVPATPINITGTDVISIRDVARRLNNAARAHRHFGPPPTSLETMLRWVAAWIGAGGAVWNKPTGVERRDGKF